MLKIFLTFAVPIITDMAYLLIPKNFLFKDDFVNKSVEVLHRMNQFENELFQIDVSEIEEMRIGDYMVFAAQIEKSRNYGNTFTRASTLPHNKHIKALLNTKNKVFHQNVNTDFEIQSLLYPQLVYEIVKGLKRVGIKQYFFPFSIFLTELIGNAVEHGIKNKNINWWLHYEIDTKTRTALFTFVDMGKGIIGSHRKAGLPLKYFLKDDVEVLLDALNGKLGSSTKLKNRGRGLPQLRDAIVNKWVSDVVIITNKAHLHYDGNNFVTNKINNNFAGTYYCWTVNLSNFREWKNSQSI